MITKHHLPSFARPRLAAERASEDGGHKSASGRGQELGLSNPARNCDDNVAVLNRRYGDCAAGGVISADARGDMTNPHTTFWNPRNYIL